MSCRAIPILFDNPWVANIYAWSRCVQPIDPREEAVIPGNSLGFSFPPDMASTMMQEQQVSPERVQVRALIDAVSIPSNGAALRKPPPLNTAFSKVSKLGCSHLLPTLARSRIGADPSAPVLSAPGGTRPPPFPCLNDGIKTMISNSNTDRLMLLASI